MNLSDDQTIIDDSSKQRKATNISNEGLSQLKSTISNNFSDRDTATSLVGCTLGSRYQINEEIGKGGFGKVYLALDSKLKRVIAVKLLSPVASSSSNFEEIFARFEQEAITIANFSHQNIVHVYDYDKDAIYGAYIVMEYIDGKSLRERIISSGKFDVNVALKIVTEVAHGLNYAHKKGIIHRDIKPGNILLTKDNVAKIVDFGLAQTETSFEYSTSGVAMGTLNYMAPEQQRDAKNVDQTADIYALGKVLYEMLSGKSPVSIIPKYIPEGFDNIIYKCIEPEPESRYLSADELLADLNSLQISEKNINQPIVTPSSDSISNKTKCPDCGHFNNEDARHCSGCGAGLIFSCPECKKEIQTGTSFCPYCGSNVVEYIKTIELFQKFQVFYNEKKYDDIFQLKEQVNKFKTSGKSGEKIKKELIKIINAAENNINTAKTIRDIEIPNAVKNINLAKLQSLISHYNTIAVPDEETEKIFQDAKDEISQTVEQYIKLLKDCHSALKEQNYEKILSSSDKINQFNPKGDEEQKVKQALIKIFEEAKQKRIKIDKIKNVLISEAITHNDLDELQHLEKEYTSLAKLTDNVRHKFDNALNVIVNNLIGKSVSAMNIDELKKMTKYLTEHSLIYPEIKRLLINAEKQIYASLSKYYINKINNLINSKSFPVLKQLESSKTFISFYDYARRNEDSFSDFLERTDSAKKLVDLYFKRLKNKRILIFAAISLIILTAASYLGYHKWKTETYFSKAETECQLKNYQQALSNADLALKYCILNKNKSKKINALIRKINVWKTQDKYDEYISESRKFLERRDFKLALSNVEQALQLQPENRLAAKLKKDIINSNQLFNYNNLIQRAKTLIKKVEYDEALDNIEKAKKCNVSNYSEATSLKRKIDKLINGKKFNNLLEQAEKYKENGEMAKAVNIAANAIKILPSETNEFYKFLTKTLKISYNDIEFIWIPCNGDYLTATGGFWMSKHEISNKLFNQFINNSPIKYNDDIKSYIYNSEHNAWKLTLNKNYRNTFNEMYSPVVCVSWNDAVGFCKWLSEKTDSKVLLPTVEQWKIAAEYPNTQNIEKNAWCNDSTTHKVASLPPNKFGVYDIYGNVWEWCSDAYKNNPAVTNAKYICGGAWSSTTDTLKNNCIRATLDTDRFDAGGFRVIADKL